MAPFTRASKKNNTPKCLKTMHTWGCKTDATQKTRKSAWGWEKCRVKGLERHILYGDAHRCSGTLRTATLSCSIVSWHQGVIYFASVSSWIVWPVINHLVTVSLSVAIFRWAHWQLSRWSWRPMEFRHLINNKATDWKQAAFVNVHLWCMFGRSNGSTPMGSPLSHSTPLDQLAMVMV